MSEQNVSLNILNNSSYYGSDISIYEPIFQDTVKTINDCVNICKNDITCDGVTYNIDTQTCIGTKNGQVRNENSNYNAWVKPPSDKISTNDMSKDFSKAILVGYTKTNTVIDSKKISRPIKKIIG